MSYVSKWFAYGKNSDLDEGIRLYERGEYQEALKHFKKVLQVPEESTVHDRARSYFAGGHGKLARKAIKDRDFDEALLHLREALDLRSGFADLWLLTARVRRILGEDAKAEYAIDRAMWLNEDYGGAYVERGVLRYRAGEPEEGLMLVKKGIELDPKLDSKVFRDGVKAHENGHHDVAMAHFAELRPGAHMVSDLMSEADQLATKGEWAEAAAVFTQTLEIAPQYADVAVRRGQCYLELNELTAAARDFQRAIGINPKYADAFALLGIALRRGNDEENALAAFRSALQLNPRHPIAGDEILFRPK